MADLGLILRVVCWEVIEKSGGNYMKKRLLELVLCLFVSLCFLFMAWSTQRESDRLIFDFSGLEKFWEVLTLLEKDEEIPPELWAQLFGTPGYAVLTKSEFSVEFFIKRFKLSFMPSRRKDLEDVLENSGEWDRRIYEHYQKIQLKKAEIREESEKIGARSSIIAGEALRAATDYLPFRNSYGYPPVSFLVFQNDGRGYSPVVIDIGKAIELNDDLVLFLAHEYHHFYRNQYLAYDPKRVQGDDENIIWVFNQLQAEGMANLVNQRPKMNDPSNRDTEFFALYDKSPDDLRRIDEYLVSIVDYPEQRRSLSLNLRKELSWSGHPTGFFMANFILETLGKDVLVESVGNPFRFMTLFQEAAKRLGQTIILFSEKAMALIHGLEAKYALLRK